MRTKRALVWLAGVAGGLVLAGVVLAQVSTHFDLSWHVLSGGGGSRGSTNYAIGDALGQWAERPSSSTSYQIGPGFWYGVAVGTPMPTSTSTSTPTRTPTRTSTPTRTPTPTMTPTGVPGDAYETDDTCGVANTITTDGAVQSHTFHDEGDEDWVKFQAVANKSYVIQVDNVGDSVDAVVMLYAACAEAPLSSEDNAFGPTVRLEWDATMAGWYYLRVLQNDPSIYGVGTNYDLSVSVDTEAPAAPRSVRTSPADESLVVQWRKSPEHDVVRYRIRWGITSGGPYGSYDEVDGVDSTYYAITGLTNLTPYYIVVTALDFSGNESSHSVEVGAIPSPTGDAVHPAVALQRPSAQAVYTTTVSNLTVGGTCTDGSNNLSRARVQNLTMSYEGWDNSLSGGTISFTVASVPLAIGDNQIQVTVYDAANNTGTDSMTIRRLSGLNGAAVIVAGHNNSYSLQSNINYAANQAYRVFKAAGFGPEDMRYLAPSPQDADSDGSNDVISTTTPANVHAALQWAADRVGPGIPFYLYMMDHGAVEAFCADGCSSGGKIESEDLDTWLTELETDSGCNLVTVIIEACHSGSFVDRVDGIGKSISKDGRVVIVSTGRTNNAYASAQGAYFSDSFFSAVAESSSLLTCFTQGKSAVGTTGNNQTPWLDDNGDGLYNPADGAYAATRYVASYFGTLLPEITEAGVALVGSTGTITGTVEQGDEPLSAVWAAVYAPSFQEPSYTSLDLGVPLIELDADPEHEGVYEAHYNGFTELGAYRVVIYAQDKVGNQAPPRLVQVGEQKAYLPLLLRSWSGGW